MFNDIDSCTWYIYSKLSFIFSLEIGVICRYFTETLSHRFSISIWLGTRAETKEIFQVWLYLYSSSARVSLGSFFWLQSTGQKCPYHPGCPGYYTAQTPPNPQRISTVFVPFWYLGVGLLPFIAFPLAIYVLGFLGGLPNPVSRLSLLCGHPLPGRLLSLWWC